MENKELMKLYDRWVQRSYELDRGGDSSAAQVLRAAAIELLDAVRDSRERR